MRTYVVCLLCVIINLFIYHVLKRFENNNIGLKDRIKTVAIIGHADDCLYKVATTPDLTQSEPCRPPGCDNDGRDRMEREIGYSSVSAFRGWLWPAGGPFRWP